MKDIDKTKEQLITELVEMRQRIAELEALKADRKQAEEMLLESEGKYGTLMEEAPVGICNVDIKGKITYVNKTILQVTGYSPEELIGKNAFRLGLIPPETLKVLTRRMKDKLMGKPPRPLEIQFKCKDGKWMWLEIRGKLLREHDVPAGVQIIGQDITQRKQAEEALQQSEERIHTIVSNAPVVIWSLDKEGVFTLSEGAGLKALGLRPGEVVGQSVFDVYSDVPELLENNRRALAGESFASIVEVGNLVFESHYSPIRDKNGEVIGMVGVSTDITERKQAEEDLIIAERNFRHSLDNSPLGVRIVTAEGELLYANQAMLDIYNYNSVEELKNTPIKERYTPESYAEFHKRSEKRKQGEPVPDSYEVSIIRKDGEVRYLIVSRKPVVWNGEIHYQTLYQDITERRQAEEALWESEEKYRTTFENTGTAMIIVEEDTTISLANHQFEILFGYSKQEIEGKKSWTEFVHQEDLERMKEYHRQRRETGEEAPRQYEFRSVDKAGDIKNIFLTVDVIPETKRSIASLMDITERKRAEEALVDEATRRRILVEQSSDGIVILDQNGKVYEANQQFAKMLGYSPEETAQLHLWDWDTQWTKEQLLKMLGSVDAAGDHFQTYHRRKDGTVYDVEISTNGAIIAGQKLVFCVCRDITERKRAEEALQESNRRFRDIAENASEWIWETNADGKYTYASPVVEKILGYEPEEVLEKHFYDLFHPDDREELKKAALEVFAKKQPFREFVNRNIHNNGETVWLSTSGVPILDEEGSLLGYRGADIDITERKQMEDVLRREKETFFSILQKAPYGVVLVSQDGRYLYINPEFTSITGYTLEDTPTGRDWFHKAYPDPEYRHKVIRTWKKDTTREMRINRVFSIVCKDGEIKEIEFRPTLLDDGSILEMLSDITERKQAEEALSLERNKLTNILDSMEDGVYIVNPQHEIEYVNPRLLSQFGPVEERKCYQYFHDLEESCPWCQNQSVFAGKTVRWEWYSFKNQRTYDLIDTPLKNADGSISKLEIFRDITEHKQAEEALKESEEFSSSLLNNSPIPIHVVNPDTSIRFANTALEKLTGFSSAEVIGRRAPYPWWPEETLQKTSKDFEKAMRKGARRVEKLFQKKNEERFWVEITGTPVMHNGELRYYLTSWFDITERKQAEEKQRELQQELIVTSRLASIGQMAAGIAHEINNPLTGVIGYAQLLREKNIPQDIKEAVDVISKGGQRVADIVQKLLTFARKTKAEKEYVDINSILTSILEMRSYEMKTSNIKLTSQLAPDLPWTMANVGQLQQVFLNIVVNAEQAMTEAHAGGRLRVKTEMINNSIRVSIADNGPGIAKEYIDRLFDPFSTTKDGGTGLGLSISYGIIKEHKGKLYAKGTLGKGATFIVELPIVAESKQLEMAEPPSQEPERVTGARIMVVDDEPTVCQFLNQVLTQEGYKVETILGSQTAFQRMNIAQYDLFLLDIKMPVISGIDLYRSMKEIDPSLQRKVIFIAGEIISPKTKAFLTKTRIPCLTKPFDLEQLRKEINRKLRQGA